MEDDCFRAYTSVGRYLDSGIAAGYVIGDNIGDAYWGVIGTSNWTSIFVAVIISY
jgi:hypothetical protein